MGELQACPSSDRFVLVFPFKSKYVYSRVSKGRDVPRDVPGQTGTGRPGTNRDGTSRCPFVPGQKSFPVPLSLGPGTKKFCLSRCPFVLVGIDCIPTYIVFPLGTSIDNV